jgi:hypothetical protein
MEKIIATFLSIIIFSAVGFAVIIESGDGGTAFAASLSVEKCKERNVSAVYVCTGNVVRVDSAVAGEGSIYYKPDGRVVYCPDVSAAEMGAECAQYAMHPNTCSKNNVCDSTAVGPVLPTNDTAGTSTSTQNNTTTKKPTGGAGIPDIEPNMDVPDRVDPPESEGGISQEVFIFAIIVVGMIAVALINYVYFKTKGT